LPADPETPSKRASPYRGPGDVDSTRKRRRITDVDDNDEYALDTNDEAFETELDHIMNTVDTPHKTPRTSEMTTPSTRRILPWNKDSRNVAAFSALQTPQTSHNIKTEPLLTPSCPADGAHRTATSPLSPFETPTPTRFKDVELGDLVHDVSALFQAEQVKLGAATEIKLRALLSKHQKAAEGIRRGRDVTRSSIKAKDAKITELSCRISTLEAELEAERAVVRHLQWEIETADDGGSGG
jgi:hypothetical protein